MSGPDKVDIVAPLLLELSREDIELLHRIVAARNAELADEGLCASVTSVVRAWIRREARRRGMLPDVPAEPVGPAPARLFGFEEEPPLPPVPVSSTLPAVLAPSPPIMAPRHGTTAEPTMISEGNDGNPLDAHPSLAPLPEDLAETTPRTTVGFPVRADDDPK
jgi:hypothetical protein